jgi:MFS family permease
VHGDRRGSRRLLAIGSACGGVAMLLPVALPKPYILYVAAVVMGFAFTCYNVLLQNVIGVLSSPQDRVRMFGNAAMAGGIGNFVGPLLSGWLIDRLGYDAAWITLAVMGFGCTLSVVVAGRSLPGPTTTGTTGTRLRDTLAGPGIARILAVSSLVQAGQDLFQFYIPVYGSTIGASASAIGLAIGAYGAATFAARFAMPNLVARLGEAWLLVGAFTLAALGFLAIPLSHDAATLALVALVFGLGMGCGQPVTTLMMFARSPAGRSGEALGVRQTFNNAVRVSAPALFGAIASTTGLLPVFLASGLMMSVGGWLMRPKRHSSKAID